MRENPQRSSLQFRLPKDGFSGHADVSGLAASCLDGAWTRLSVALAASCLELDGAWTRLSVASAGVGDAPPRRDQSPRAREARAAHRGRAPTQPHRGSLQPARRQPLGAGAAGPDHRRSWWCTSETALHGRGGRQWRSWYNRDSASAAFARRESSQGGTGGRAQKAGRRKDAARGGGVTLHGVAGRNEQTQHRPRSDGGGVGSGAGGGK